MNRPADETAPPASDEPPSLPPGADAAAPSAPGFPLAFEPGIDVRFEAPDVDPPAADWLAETLEKAVALADVGPVALAICVVNDADMDRFHRLHSGVAGTTDVLTFDNRDSAGDPIDGDLVLCRDEAVRRATELGHDARVELLLYALHGVMHLDGEDDHDPDAHRRMHEREDRILTALGLGPVFYRGGASA